MKNKLLILLALFPLVGCNLLRKIPGYGKDTPPEVQALPDDYTVTGVTQSDFEVVSIRTENSILTIRVNRHNAPEAGWHECDQFEYHVSKAGGKIQLRYLNLVVGGISFPVAPKGSEFEVRSIKLSTDHNLY